MTEKRLFLVLVFCFCAQFVALHAFENLKFDHYTIENGLSQNTVYAITQDHKGFLWIATQNGLNKFNGIDFAQYRNDSSQANCLSENNVFCLFLNRREALWIGTRGGGLNRLDLKTERFTSFVHDGQKNDSISDNFISAIAGTIDSDVIWVGTENNGLNKFDARTNTAKRFLHDAKDPGSLSGNRISAMYRDRAGRLWVAASEDGLNLMSEDSGRFEHFIHDDKNSASLGDNFINAIYEDSRGNMWFGTRKGLALYNQGKKAFRMYQHDPNDPGSISSDRVSAIFEDGKGRFWVGTEDGLNLLNRDQGVFTSYRENAARRFGLSSGNVTHIYEDSAGTVWFGTLTGGLNKLSEKKFVHVEKDPLNANSLTQNSIWAIGVDHQGIVWLGTENSGLCEYDRDKGVFTTYAHQDGNPSSLCSNMVETVFEDSRKRLWVGTDRGLCRFDRPGKGFSSFLTDVATLPSISCSDIAKIIEDREGKLWLATYGGVGVFDPEKQDCRWFVPLEGKNSLSHKKVRTAFLDSEGLFWFGTEAGLDRFDPKTGIFTHYSHDPKDPESLSHNRVYSIAEGTSGTLWVSTIDGLNRFDKHSGKCRRYSEKSGLSNNTVYGVLIDRRGALWLSTNNGLNRMDPESGEVKAFNVDDGLQSNEFNMGAFFQSDKGEMFFGGINGFNTFVPENITYNTRIPPVVLTAFRLLDKVVMSASELSVTPRLDLSYRDNFFAFEFAALDFMAPLKNRYAYKMEGFDPDWIYCGSRRYAAYTNLSGGSFVFRVKAANSDGVWNEAGATIAIEIPPPPWKTWWAYSLYVLSVFGLFAGYLGWQRRQHEREMSFQKMLNDAANRFVPHEYLAILGKNDILEVGLGDQVQKDMTIFFSDIRSFTDLSEKLSPKENIDFINDYLSRVGPVIRTHRGFIDKYIGDAVMALFEHSPDDAVDAAIASLQAVTEFNEHRLRRSEKPIRIGIGLNTGTLMLGTVGEHNRINATVISDAVNLASRVEGQTKMYGAEILITDSTFKNLAQPQKFLIRTIDKIQVKGKNQAVCIYEVCNGAGAARKDYITSILSAYEEAIALYYQKRFKEADSRFRECLRDGFTDICVNLYLERCQSYLENPPPDDWNGVTRLRSK